MVKNLLPKLIAKELYYIVQYFDRGNKNSVTKKDFLDVMTSEF